MDSETTNPAEGEDNAAAILPEAQEVDHESAAARDREPIDADEESEEIEHEGRRYAVPRALKPLLLMQADYTRKTQEVAEQRRAVQAERQALQQASEAELDAYGAQQTTLGAAPQIQGQSYQAPQLGAAPQAQAYGYQAPTLNAPGLVSGKSYTAPQLGAAGSYAAARTGSPIGAQSMSYNPTSMTQAAIAPTQDAFASGANAASGLTNLAAYQNPYQQDVVGATLNSFDEQAGRTLAAILHREDDQRWLEGGYDDICSMAVPFPSQLMAVA